MCVCVWVCVHVWVCVLCVCVGGWAGVCVQLTYLVFAVRLRLLNTRTTITRMTIAVVTAIVRAIATTPPMIAAVLPVSEQLHLASSAVFLASQASDAVNQQKDHYTETNIRTCYCIKDYRDFCG